MNTRDEILLRTDDGLDVFRYFISDLGSNPKRKFRNPFYDDKNPSCCLYRDKKSGKWMFHDHGDPRYHGDCFWLVAMRNGLDVEKDFRQVLQVIINSLSLPMIVGDNNNSTQMPPAIGEAMNSQTQKAGKEISTPKIEKPKRFKAEALQWKESDLRFWGRYGITKDTLRQFNVESIDYYTADGSCGTYSKWSSQDSPMYGYVFDKFIKVYRPFEKGRDNRFRIIGNYPSNYCFGWKQLPNFGDILFITGGEKDVMSLSAHGFNAICFQSETANVHLPTLQLARERFKYLILLYDCDETGVRRMAQLSEELEAFGVYAMKLPLSGTKADKDISDYFAKGLDREDLRLLVKALIREENTKERLLVDSCKLDLTVPFSPSPVLISAGGVPLVSAGGLMCVTGNVGTGKSHFIGALLSGAICTDVNTIDTLGVMIAPNYFKRAVLHFDTEQTKDQLTKNELIMLKRAGISGVPPFYQSFHLTANSLEERLTVIRAALDEWHFEHDGIHLAVIDGVADLVQSANDEGPSNSLVRELMKMAGMYNTCIICVVHTLPNLQKLRGHLGSELMRKSTSIVSIEKDEENKCSFMKTLKVRDGDMFSVPKLTFAWDDDAGMFIATGQKEDARKASIKKERLSSITVKLFEKRAAYDYKTLWQAIIQEVGGSPEISERTAKSYIKWMKEEEMIIQNDNKQYIINKNKHHD